MPELSIVIATYNEAENLPILIEQMQPYIEHIDSELIIVDDNSPDGTPEAAHAIAEKYDNIKVIIRKDESGLASALLRGFDESEGKYILTMDSDLSHNPNHIPEMITLLRNEESDIIIGSRYVKGGKVVGKPFVKSMASKGAQWIAKLWIGMPVKDASNNFRMFPKSVYTSVKEELHPDGNVMLMEFIFRAGKKGFRFKELPILYYEREHGETKLLLFKEIKRFLRNMYRIRFP